MAWRRPGDKPLSEPRMECLLTHICVTRPQWVNILELHLYPSLNSLHMLRPAIRLPLLCWLRENKVKAMAADALASSVARTSANMALTKQDKQILALHELIISTTCAFSVSRNIRKYKHIFMFSSKKVWHGLSQTRSKNIFQSVKFVAEKITGAEQLPGARRPSLKTHPNKAFIYMYFFTSLSYISTFSSKHNLNRTFPLVQTYISLSRKSMFNQW